MHDAQLNHPRYITRLRVTFPRSHFSPPFPNPIMLRCAHGTYSFLRPEASQRPPITLYNTSTRRSTHEPTPITAPVERGASNACPIFTTTASHAIHSSNTNHSQLRYLSASTFDFMRLEHRLLEHTMVLHYAPAHSIKPCSSHACALSPLENLDAIAAFHERHHYDLLNDFDLC